MEPHSQGIGTGKSYGWYGFRHRWQELRGLGKTPPGTRAKDYKDLAGGGFRVLYFPSRPWNPMGPCGPVEVEVGLCPQVVAGHTPMTAKGDLSQNGIFGWRIESASMSA